MALPTARHNSSITIKNEGEKPKDSGPEATRWLASFQSKYQEKVSTTLNKSGVSFGIPYKIIYLIGSRKLMIKLVQKNSCLPSLGEDAVD